MCGKYIAVDMGAESGRLVQGNVSEGKLKIKELHRFKTQGTEIHGHLYWDVLRFYDEIVSGIKINASAFDGESIDGIGVDTWGVDFVILDEHDNLIGMPYHYRDTEMNAAFSSLLNTIPRDEIYEKTGIQFMSLNTIVKLHALVKGNHTCMSNGKNFLMMPDYFNFLLTGEKKIEYTDASTTQLLDAMTRDWYLPFFETLGVNPSMFTSPVMPGAVLGDVVPALCNRMGVEKAVVHLTTSHDTASAVVGCPLSSKNSAYISSGTWSLLGMEIDSPILTKKALEMNFTNEGGFGGTIRLLKNIAGMWLLQQSKSKWEQDNGVQIDYEWIMQEAMKNETFGSLVNPDHERFMNPQNMLEAIRTACKETGQLSPKTFGEFAATIFSSLALRYRHVISMLSELSGTTIDYLHVVGGGSKNRLLCQYTADATGLQVFAGPDEATSIGNLIVQAISNGEIAGVQEGRELVTTSFPPRMYEPQNQDRWTRLYEEKYIPLFIEN